MKLKSHITDSLEVAGVGAFNSVERLIPSLFKLEIQRYRLRVFPITATVKIGFKGPPGLTTSDDTTYWARSNSTEYEPGCKSDRSINY
ncbi:uncharacterized protein LOC110429569 isoform X2 [Sorghum bicolor]|uniref:uncharacterized protein LOC110429569 isoform X2 n=1 Tax=Sorghum bicolor TaxID=4558 RepID=UPI000B425CDF|nr:uncharacterized protein LOC110429569 isoform X2 [Sorghum bicolor]XP_021301346.1 uncharacterized protein LOC110429569 isoform X2 [Sorghum bicolor]XP_021301347.1 uncharacterized protein LOC110429569 isoform X2 [Sorghum bicolor]XP_021301348.1 uncharacterized protein LOC110429569 isoform X2 [Sorghum bicolor]|eukprot:XP_021301345.1 uncharacterized protein LOC110429569 isoform X2 [Sorghum bicolor]